MKIKNYIYIGLSAALCTGGCATSGDIDNLQRQIRMVHQQMENMKATTMEKLQKRQATASSHLDQLEQDITQLRAQIEESYYLNQRLREQNKELEAAISNVAEQESVKREQAFQALIAEQQEKEAKIQQMLKRQQENVKAIQAARVRELERKAKEAKLAAQLAQQRKNSLKRGAAVDQTEGSRVIYATRKKVKRAQYSKKSAAEVVSKTTSSPSPQKPLAITPKTASETLKTSAPPVAPVGKVAKKPVAKPSDSRMEKGKRLLQQKRYQQAFTIFEDIAKNNTSKDQVSARFMLGECQFAMKQYDLAVVNYQSVVSKSPGSAIAPQALLRQAQAFEKMADKDTAKLVYSKIIDKYGASPQAATAKEQLKQL